MKHRTETLLLGSSAYIFSILLPTIFSQLVYAGNIPSGFITYINSSQSENFIFVRGDDYLVPCISRNPNECPSSGIDYGGKITIIKPGVVRAGGFYFCAEHIIPKGVSGKCTATGFVRNK